MNMYKARDIISYIKSKGPLPTDRYGHVLSVDDLLIWFDLNKLLNQEEREHMKKELLLMTESQLCMDRLRS